MADLGNARTACSIAPRGAPGPAVPARVRRPGGPLGIGDLGAPGRPYRSWLRARLAGYHPDESDTFFDRAGFDCRRVHTTGQFADRASLAAVLKIEFSERVAARAIGEV